MGPKYPKENGKSRNQNHPLEYPILFLSTLVNRIVNIIITPKTRNLDG